jgi:NDP-sugar pyrophosphorylase family protein
MPELSLERTDVLILVGGQGKRLRQVVNDRPKPMADVGGRPFLDLLVEYTSNFGLNRFVLATGYKTESVQAHYQKTGGPRQIIFSNEDEPLGTAGAIKNAQNLIISDTFIVMNGDSFCPVYLPAFFDFHIEKNALLSIVLVPAGNNQDFGVVELNDSRQVVRFEEKKIQKQETFISAGIYLFQRDIFSFIPARTRCSLEYDILPKLVGPKFYGYVTEAELIDIGTPCRYKQAIRYFEMKNRRTS